MKPKDWPSGVPYIDSLVRWVGVSELRGLNSTKLSELNDTMLVLADNSKPLAVVISYGAYLSFQKIIEGLMDLNIK